MKQNSLKQFIALSVLTALIIGLGFIDISQTKAADKASLHTAGNLFANTASSAESNSDSFLEGEWRAVFRVNDMQCQWDAVFHPDGSYAATTQCYNTPYSVYYSGSWYMLNKTSVRLQYTECSPRQCPVSGGTLNFQIIDQNTIRLSDRVAYRVG